MLCSLLGEAGCSAKAKNLRTDSGEAAHLPVRAALVIPDRVRSFTVSTPPCTLPVSVRFGEELEAQAVHTLKNLMERVEVVRDRQQALNQFDLVVELSRPEFSMEGNNCGIGQWLLAPVTLGFSVVSSPGGVTTSFSFYADVRALDGKTLESRQIATRQLYYETGNLFGVASWKVEEALKVGFQKTMNELADTVSTSRSVVAYLQTLERGEVASSSSSRDFRRPTKENQTVNIEEVPQWAEKPRPQDVAVVIGVERYQTLTKAEYATKDATLVQAYLTALGFRAANIEVLLNERATYAGVRRTLQSWLPNRVKPDSRVLVYYSGHGAPDPVSGETYLVPFDGDAGALQDTSYPVKKLYETLGQLPAQEVVVMLDACFSGLGGRSVLASGTKPLVNVRPPSAVPANVAVLAAAEPTQISTSDPAVQHGVFTYQLLKAMKEGKRTVVEIYETMRPAVEDQAKRLNVRQTPVLMPPTSQIVGQFVLR